MAIVFEDLVLGEQYERPFLAQLWGYRDWHALARGIITPQDENKIVLFITKEKQNAQTPYVDHFDGDTLHIEGETSHANDERLLHANKKGDQVHLFYRERHHSAFTYCGELVLTNCIVHSEEPSKFEFSTQRSLAVNSRNLTTRSTEIRKEHRQKRAWLLLAIEGKRQHGGNDGYADVPGKIYRFDSFVPNARHINAGDIAIFRDRTGAFGFASVHQVNSTDGEKTLLRCPDCNVIQIKERTTVTPKYRCRSGHLFDTPTAEVRKCKQYEAHFGDSFIKADTVIAAVALPRCLLEF